MSKWILVPCDCEDGFMAICLEHEEPCDHDILCKLCQGTGERPVRATPIDALVGGEFFPTRKAAREAAIG